MVEPGKWYLGIVFSFEHWHQVTCRNFSLTEFERSFPLK